MFRIERDHGGLGRCSVFEAEAYTLTHLWNISAITGATYQNQVGPRSVMFTIRQNYARPWQALTWLGRLNQRHSAALALGARAYRPPFRVPFKIM